MMCNYLQTSNKNAAEEFIKTVPEDLVIEITVHGKDKKLKTPHAYVYIDEVLVYDLDFVKEKYINLKRNSEFYMTPAEAFALNMYLCCGIFETIPPHWWPYAERNIARHHDPLADLREAQKHAKKIVVTVD